MLVENRNRGFLGTIFVCLASAAVVWTAAEVLPGISVDRFWPDAFWAALAIGVTNMFVRPIIYILTLPITFLTLGLFGLVLNALMLWLSSLFIEGFHISGIIPAFVGALFISIVSSFISWFFGKKKSDD